MTSIRDTESFIAAMARGYDPHFIFFWSHQPRRDGKIGKSCLSQWWPSPFEVGGITYPTAEHYMMAGKASLFGDEETLEKILMIPDPRIAKRLGRSVRGFDEDLWQAHRRDIVLRGSEAKFSQNPELLTFLLNTGTCILVEASPFDRIWGIGLNESDPRTLDPTQWCGQSLFGFVLMEVRSRLRNVTVQK